MRDAKYLFPDNQETVKATEIPGSHVIVKTNGKELPDRTYEEAAMLATYYSKGR